MGNLYVRQAVKQLNWTSAGSLTTAQAVLTTDKTAATAHALTSTGICRIEPSDNTVSMQIRFRCDGSDGDSNTLVIYSMAGTDSYDPIITLTTTNGTQSDGTYTFIDTITSTNEKWSDDIRVNSNADNAIASIEFNTHGMSDFLVIATTLNSTGIYVDWRRV